MTKPDPKKFPPQLEVREAIPRGREAYIGAGYQLDIIRKNFMLDRNHGADTMPLAIAFDAINAAQQKGDLQPPLTPELEGLVTDTCQALSVVQPYEAKPSDYDLRVGTSYEHLESARLLLLVVVDHGTRGSLND